MVKILYLLKYIVTDIILLHDVIKLKNKKFWIYFSICKIYDEKNYLGCLGILNLKSENEKKNFMLYDTIQLLMWLLFLYRVSQLKLAFLKLNVNTEGFTIQNFFLYGVI